MSLFLSTDIEVNIQDTKNIHIKMIFNNNYTTEDDRQYQLISCKTNKRVKIIISYCSYSLITTKIESLI